jgi:broad specificity phosphatase PhoE
MSDRVRVWCLRHAEAEHVTTGTAGAVPIAPLTARGRQQAVVAAQQLSTEPIARIYCSTALRARQTAALLATTPGLLITAMPELVEVGIPAEVLRAWIVEQDLGQQVAGGETGHQVIARVTTAFRKIASNHPGETVAVVGHVASLTVALGRLCALGARVWGTPLPHARPFQVEGDGRTWRCPDWPGALDGPSSTPLPSSAGP